jgi:hypothetical protein
MIALIFLYKTVYLYAFFIDDVNLQCEIEIVGSSFKYFLFWTDMFEGFFMIILNDIFVIE